MQTRTYTERSNARRAARAAGIDVNTIIETEDGFEVRFGDAPEAAAATKDHPLKQAVDAAVERGISPTEFVKIAETAADELDGIPDFCKISPEARKAAWERNPPKAVAVHLAAPKTEDPATAKLRQEMEMAKKAKTTNRINKLREKKGLPPVTTKSTGGDKNATLLSMLKGKGSTVEAMIEALGWLPHTLRARISRLNKPKSKGGEGLNIERARADGVTTYRIAS